MSRLLIVQPYIPTYRLPLFADLRTRLASEGVELRLATGSPRGASALRADANSEEADTVLRESTWTVAGRTLNFRHLSEHLRALQPDFVIVEQAIKNAETYPLLARQAMGRGPRIAMWGQGRSYSTPQATMARRLKMTLTRCCDWFFAYTQEGADYVVAQGVDRSRITVLLNSTDTAALRADLQSVTDDQLARFQARHGLVTGFTGLFLGGVDESKGIGFLVAAARRVAQQIPGFRLLIGGEGARADFVRECQAAGEPLIALGRIDGQVRALALRSADLMLVPQWVGLVAVDSLAAGVPVVTTRHPSHSPEFGYLTDGVNSIVTAHELEAYASAIVSLLRDSDRRASMAERARIDSLQYSIEGMSSRFVEGVLKWSERR